MTDAGMSAMASVRFWAVTTTSSRKPRGFDGSSAGAGDAGGFASGDVFFAASAGGASWAQATLAASRPRGRADSFSKDA